MIVLKRFLLVILLIECLVFLAPFVISSAWYFKLFLGEKTLERIDTFYNGHNPSTPDEHTGWRTTPNFIEGKWVIDQWGSRSHQEINFTKPPGVPRVLFLGNSLVNGGNTLSSEETISYFFEQAAQADDKKIEVMNFGTMAYNPGQSLLQLKERLLEFKPDHVIFGIPEAAHAGLSNLFLPFYLIEERNMPYVKPGFFKNNDEIEIIAPPHAQASSNPKELLHFLAANDHYYHEFFRYKHFGQSPILWSIDYFAHRASNLYGYLHFNYDEFEILSKILAEVEATAAEADFEVSYIFIPTPRAFRKSIIWRNLPDYYAKRLEVLSTPNDFNPNGLPILDLRAVIDRSKQPLHKIYAADMFHFSSEGNRVIGRGIYRAISDKIINTTTEADEKENIETQRVNPNLSMKSRDTDLLPAIFQLQPLLISRAED